MKQKLVALFLGGRKPKLHIDLTSLLGIRKIDTDCSPLLHVVLYKLRQSIIVGRLELDHRDVHQPDLLVMQCVIYVLLYEAYVTSRVCDIFSLNRFQALCIIG